MTTRLPSEWKTWLRDYQSGKIKDQVLWRKIKKYLYHSHYQVLGDIRIDKDRRSRTGIEEVIFAEGKTSSQILKIITKIFSVRGRVVPKRNPLLITRLSPKVFSDLKKNYEKSFKSLPLIYHQEARVAHSNFEKVKKRSNKSQVAIITAGTSDSPVAEECSVVLNHWKIRTEKYYDVGVAGIDRLLGVIDQIKKNSVVIVVAGMEAALASVVGGLVSAPIIAVPTSIGYGANFKGLSSLLGMLNSCSPGVMVVNIDNGFGAAAAARKILSIS